MDLHNSGLQNPTTTTQVQQTLAQFLTLECSQPCLWEFLTLAGFFFLFFPPKVFGGTTTQIFGAAGQIRVHGPLKPSPAWHSEPQPYFKLLQHLRETHGQHWDILVSSQGQNLLKYVNHLGLCKYYEQSRELRATFLYTAHPSSSP